MHDEYKTACELKYNEEYKTFWADIQLWYGQLFRTQVRLDMREGTQQTVLATLQRKSVCFVDSAKRMDENKQQG